MGNFNVVTEDRKGPRAMNGTFTTADGLKLAYYIDDFTDPWRKPDTLLLLHADMGNSRRWFQWVPRLTREYRVVRLDLRGHGNSEIPKPTDDFSLSLLVSDALALLDLVGVLNAHIVGNSAGGYVSQQLAIRHPQRVKTLALFGSTPGLKHSHASTWIPKIKEIGLKQFLADTIDERFESSADPELSSGLSSSPERTTRPSLPASSFTCVPTIS